MPASFPGAVKTFATRSAGQTIDPGHVNDLQDEVTAIETGYLNGTAPLNSSHAAVAGLSVVGNSTIGSTVTMGPATYQFPSSGGSSGHVLTCVSTSGSTMALEWRSILDMLATIPVVWVTHSAGQAIASDSNAVTGLAWDTEVDAYGMHSTTTNSSRINFSATTGVYLIGASVSFDKKTGVNRLVGLRINDSSRVAVSSPSSPAVTASLNDAVSVSAIFRATSTADYFTVVVTSADGGSTVVAHSTSTPQRAYAKLLV